MRLSIWASVKLTIILFSLIATSIIIGAWCPQESQVGFQKVVDTFGADFALKLRAAGITDIFHSPFFLALIALLTINMIACSVQRVFPKARLFLQKPSFFTDREITKLPVNHQIQLHASPVAVSTFLKDSLRKKYYSVFSLDNNLAGQWGKFSLLAATVTHIGLLSLLCGVTVTSWTGFNGFKAVALDDTMNFSDSEHSKLWVGKLPPWIVHVDDTHREDYTNGDAKQWYSSLSILDSKKKTIKRQEISVNNPLSFNGVDIYQSSWGLDSILVSFNGHVIKLPLQEMGRTHAAFLPLDESTILIFSLRGQNKPLKVFGKIPQWTAPKLLAEVPVGHKANFGSVVLTYLKAIPVTGLQYKCDPGLPITFLAFGIIITGVLLATVPYHQVWCYVKCDDDTQCILFIGGFSNKAKSVFARNLANVLLQVKKEFSDTEELLINTKELDSIYANSTR